MRLYTEEVILLGGLRNSNTVNQILERPVLQILIQTPSFDLAEHFSELLARNGLINKTLTATEPAEVPWAVLKLGRNAVLPPRQVLS